MSETIECENCSEVVPEEEAARELGPGLGNETWYCSPSCAMGLEEGLFDE